MLTDFHQLRWKSIFVNMMLLSWGIGVHLSWAGTIYIFMIIFGPFEIGIAHRD